MFVYFVRAVSGGPVKIGKADNPAKRLEVLQACSPEKLEILAVCLGGLAAEKHIHRRFAATRLHGEWFQWSEALASLLRRLPSWESVQGGAFCPELLDTDRAIMLRLYALGYTYEDIGKVYGKSRQRIYQILADFPSSGLRQAVKEDGVWRHFKLRPKHEEEVPDRPKKPDEPVETAFVRLSAELSGIDLVLETIE